MAFEYCSIVNLEQNTPEWLEWRNQGIGASEVAAIMGLSKWDTPLSLWAKKTGIIPPQSEENEAMEWGHLMEPILVDKWCKANSERGVLQLARGPVYQRNDEPWMRASLDAVALLKDGSWEIIECKEVGSIDGWTDDINGSETVPIYYLYQAIWQMAVTGISRVNFSVRVSNGYGRTWISRVVERDQAFERSVIYLVSLFWDKVLKNNSPELTEGLADVDAKAIKAIIPSIQDDVTIDLGDEGEELLLERSALEAQIKALDDRKTTIENRIKLLGGEAKKATANGRPVFTASAYNRESIDSKSLREKYPDIATQFVKITPVRTWRFA